MNSIRHLLETFAPMSDKDWHIFKSKLTPKTYPKKSIVLKKGRVEHYLSFVQSGILRFYIPKIENDLTFGFVFENEFISAYDSFLIQGPCQYEVETIVETTLWRIHYEDLQAIYNETKIGNEIGRKNAETLFLKKSGRELSLLNKSAEERYLDLFTERPELIKKIPLKYIASYIGITPQALSRIRRRIS